MRQNGVVDTASGLIPFGHLGWTYRSRAEFRAQAAEYIADGLKQGQRVVFVGDSDHEGLRAELAAVPGVGGTPEVTAIDVVPVGEFYAFHPDSDLVDAEAAVAKRVAAVEEALAAGYTGYRAVVDATSVARTPAQRAAFSRFEFLIDQKMAVLPISALCAYDADALGDAAEELVCLHPFVGTGEVPFRLYAEPSADLALSGEVDLASHELFTTTTRRAWALHPGSELRIDAGGLDFVNHRQLLTLDQQAREYGHDVVLRTGRHLATRLVGLLELSNVHVEHPASS